MKQLFREKSRAVQLMKDMKLLISAYQIIGRFPNVFLVYSILLVKAWEYALSALCEHVLASRDYFFCKNKTDHSFMV
ncbi:hypothetical protein CHH97_00005, partial [Bacillus licheniformis]